MDDTFRINWGDWLRYPCSWGMPLLANGVWMHPCFVLTDTMVNSAGRGGSDLEIQMAKYDALSGSCSSLNMLVVDFSSLLNTYRDVKVELCSIGVG